MFARISSKTILSHPGFAVIGRFLQTIQTDEESAAAFIAIARVARSV
jgi:hypothetical protein